MPRRPRIRLAGPPQHIQRCAAYRALFRPQLDAAAVTDIRQALQLGMPLGSALFAETICARTGQRRNSGKRGKPVAEGLETRVPIAGQQDFGF